MATTPDEARPDSLHDDPRTETADDPLVSRTSGGAPDGLSLLDDEYAQEILTVLSEGPQRGRDLAAACDASRPTVYRRVNRLEEAGLVTAEIAVDPDGHHAKEFHLVRDRLTVTIEDGAITVTARQSADESEPLA